MQIAIVIVTYNSEKWLEKCLKSCQLYAPSVPVYVVDNASIDNTVAIIRRYYPLVHLLSQHMNLGFAAGNNVGLSAALTAGAEAVLLLNQDAELTEDAVWQLGDYLTKHPSVGAVQPLIILPSGLVNSAGNSFHYLGFGEAGGNGLTIEQAWQKLPWLKQSAEPPYLSGAAMMVRAAAWRQVGPLQDELFMYHEDLEFSLRLRAAGWKLGLEPEARVIHHYESHRSLKQIYYMERNRLLVWSELFRGRTLLVLLPAFLMAEAILLFLSLMNGWFIKKLQSYAYFLRGSAWRCIRARRRQWAALRRLSDRELLNFASSSLENNVSPTGTVFMRLFNILSTLVWGLLKPLIR